MVQPVGVWWAYCVPWAVLMWYCVVCWGCPLYVAVPPLDVEICSCPICVPRLWTPSTLLDAAMGFLYGCVCVCVCVYCVCCVCVCTCAHVCWEQFKHAHAHKQSRGQFEWCLLPLALLEFRHVKKLRHILLYRLAQDLNPPHSSICSLASCSGIKTY